MSARKKLIEVALPLEAINQESAREKSIRHGHPSTLHLWWSRKPLATCRAVLFASLVDDPSSHPEQFPTDADQQRERERLFRIVEELVKWENSNNERVLSAAHAEIMRSTGGNPPPVYDPFAGGGSIPLEAQRLGLEAHASDLNPVAVLINKALIEIPPKFANTPPVNPIDRNRISAEWKGAAGLAADVRYYGKWMRDELEKRIGHLYPKVKLPKQYGEGEAIVIAWLYCRSVQCPNPACGVMMPLIGKFWLSSKAGKKTWVEPVINPVAKNVNFEIRSGEPDPSVVKQIDMGSSAINSQGKRTKATFICVACGNGVARGEYIDMEANQDRMKAIPLAIVAEINNRRTYLPFDDNQMEIAFNQSRCLLKEGHIQDEIPSEPSRGTFASNAQGRIYGFKTFADYFTPRQLITLSTLTQLIKEVRERISQDARPHRSLNDKNSVISGVSTSGLYADAVSTYLALAIDKMIDTNTSICTWQIDPPRLRATFGRQAVPMTWDFAEANIFGDAAGDYQRCVGSLCEVLERLNVKARGVARQIDITIDSNMDIQPIIITDPPYYDNIEYSDLSDFFYVWLRRSLSPIYPELFGTLLTPKAQELVATAYRFDGNKDSARGFFEAGLSKAFMQMREIQNSNYPLTIFYAFKQAEQNEEEEDNIKSSSGFSSTGWETMLEGLLKAKFVITGTWPMRSELATRNVGRNTNALASSIALICRLRSLDAPSTTRLEFIRALRRELPEALRLLQKGNIAPVDLAQAAIGPGMAIFSRHGAVLEADGTPLRVRTALQLINQALDEVLAEQEGEYDTDTRWAVAWFDQFGVDEGPFGTAETLSKAKNTSVGGMVEAGIAVARAGKVRLLKRDELPKEWEPAGDKRLTAWETVQHLVHALDKRGEQGAAELLARIPGDVADVARDLAYRLYATCERKKWAQEALAYNALVVAWPEIARLATERAKDTPVQGRMFE